MTKLEEIEVCFRSTMRISQEDVCYLFLCVRELDKSLASEQQIVRDLGEQLRRLREEKR